MHNAADTLEHATDDLLISRLNEFLGEPERCLTVVLFRTTHH
ncbi:iron dependent repressor, metal binding and dimerization domain protein [Holzapfeliella floricola]